MNSSALRVTPQRRAVLDVLSSSDHPTAAEVLERVQHQLPGVGAATVYRTLALLVEAGQAAMLRVHEGDAARYDRTVERHDHLVCTECRRVTDAQVSLDAHQLDQLAGQSSFVMTGYEVHIYGRCAKCAAASENPKE
ncbi:MAG TPA: transcriptional repressor [Jatrophihabitantaceae bacterium]|jgi:Fe2+ or Zn2+ uptake regulation protein|nr:transcriptional repressor [Jatrophihabitantaceae bacterium]